MPKRSKRSGPSEGAALFDILTDNHSAPSPSRAPVWKGPAEDGITFSLLSRYLVCKERFRLRVIEGLQPADRFNHRMEFGTMWHICEEALARGKDPTAPRRPSWEEPLLAYARSLSDKYPIAREEISHWYEVVKTTFPVYEEYWSKHQDVRDRRPLLQEQSFSVPYSLPSGRVVRLRGKWDSVDLIGRGRDAKVYLQENKTKGGIREGQLLRQVSSGYDLQTMLYLVALLCETQVVSTPTIFSAPIAGVRYNVVRRPLSGGKGSIVRRKPTKANPAGESRGEFYKRLAGVIGEEPGYWFLRWKVEVSPEDLTRFRRTCLDPILENLCDDWQWWDDCKRNGPPVGYDVWDNRTREMAFGHHLCRHYVLPFGLYNPLLEGGSDDMDEYLVSGSETGLERTENLFPELEE